MADKHLFLYCAGVNDNRITWVPEVRGKSAIRIHQLYLNYEHEVDIGTAEISVLYVVDMPIADPVHAWISQTPRDIWRQFGNRMLWMHTMRESMDGTGIWAQTYHHVLPFPVPHDCMCVTFAMTGNSNGYPVEAVLGINYEIVDLSDAKWEQMLAHNPWLVNSRQPTSTKAYAGEP